MSFHNLREQSNVVLALQKLSVATTDFCEYFVITVGLDTLLNFENDVETEDASRFSWFISARASLVSSCCKSTNSDIKEFCSRYWSC